MARRQPTFKHIDRRGVLSGLAASGVAGHARARADDPLQQRIQQNQRGGLGEGFDAASRTIRMPKASLPTLAPETVQHTEMAIARYEQVVANGGWPEVPGNGRLRRGARNPAVIALRQRLKLAGDLDPAAVENDVYDSYVETAVRRFQARHGLSTDGRPGKLTFDALNVPADQRLSQLKTNLMRLRAFDTKSAQRFVVCNIPAAQLEAIETGTVMSRHIA